MDARSTSEDRRGIAAMLAAAGSLLAASLAVFWPGYVQYDSVAQYAQILSGHYDDWHPPVMVRLWGLLHLIAAGAGPMLAVGLAGYWAGFGLVAAGLVRAGRRGAAVMVLLLGCWPPFLGWEAVVLKDAQLLAALLAVTGLVGFWRLAERRVAGWAWLPVAVIVAYALLLRANAVFAVAPLVAGLAPMRRLRSRVMAGAVLLVATLALSPVVNHRLLGATASGVERTQPLYDLAGISVRAGPVPGGFDAREVRALVDRGCVRPFFWDPLGDDSRCGSVSQRLLREPSGRLYVALALAAATHPIAYAAHRTGHLNSTWRWWTPAAWPDAAPPRGSEPNDLGLGQPHDALATGWQRVAGIAVLTPLGWPIAWIVTAAAALIATRAARGAQPALARALLLSALLLEGSFAGISIASDLRYHLWPMVATALALVLLAGQRWSARARRGGTAMLALVIATGLIARATLPEPPQGYRGMLG